MDIYVMLFFIYSFFGWICEVLYVGLITEKRFYNRGFLNLPLIPIYGFGSILITATLSDLSLRIGYQFLLVVIMTSILEYLTSYLMESFFHLRWWDYSQRKFNINGRVCLRNSLLFGFGGLIVIHLSNYLIPILNEIDIDTIRTINVIGLLAVNIDLYFVLRKLIRINLRDIHQFSGERIQHTLHIPYRYQAELLSKSNFNIIVIINLCITGFILLISRNLFVSLHYFAISIFIILAVTLRFNSHKHK